MPFPGGKIEQTNRLKNQDDVAPQSSTCEVTSKQEVVIIGSGPIFKGHSTIDGFGNSAYQNLSLA